VEGKTSVKTNPFVTCYVLRPKSGGYDILQLLRRPGVYMAETWQPVSGAIEPDEAGWQAALRELMEETGLAPERFYRLPTTYPFYIPQLDSLSYSICFCAIVAEGSEVAINFEHTDHRWVDFAECDALFMWPSDHGAISEIRRYVLNTGLCSPHLVIDLE
jgi:dATP pyrophosphohydrolase